MYKRNGIGIGIEYFEPLKKPCLYVYEEDINTATKVASFNSEKTATWFAEKVDEFLEGMIISGG